MSAETFKQEMPPPGGYRPLNFERTLPRKFFTLKTGLFLLFVPPLIWLWSYRKERRFRFIRELDYRNHINAIEPCLVAERDRLYLKQLRANRDEEAELMKDVPGWVVGTLFGDKVYRTVPEDFLVNPDINEYYTHTKFAFLTEYFHLDLRR